MMRRYLTRRKGDNISLATFPLDLTLPSSIAVFPRESFSAPLYTVELKFYVNHVQLCCERVLPEGIVDKHRQARHVSRKERVG